MENAKTYLVPLGRLLMSSLFIWAGFGKLINLEPARLGTSPATTCRHLTCWYGS